jgi:hypothetical protein
MEFIFALLGFIVLMGLVLAFAAHKLREEGECTLSKPKYCCHCGNRLRPDMETQATDTALQGDC